MTIAPADSTLVFIKKKVRRLAASSSTSALTEADLEQYINNFYNNDFAYAIKIDQMRSVYTFYTTPNVDTYPLDVNYNQGIRDPVYFEGVQGYFFKDRNQFYNMWPRWPTRFTQGATALSGTITGVTNAVNAQITSVANGLVVGDVIVIDNVGGTTQLNGNTYTVVTIVDANNFTINVDSTAFGVYTSGGTWTSTDRSFLFTLGSGTPILPNEVVIGGVDQGNNQITIRDNGTGILQLVTSASQVSVPSETGVAGVPQPGMYNLNTQNPGLQTLLNIGTVNYTTATFTFMLPNGIALQSGTLFNIWVSQFMPSRPYALLFWNNQFKVRPVPDNVYKVEVETYLTPVQFLSNTDNPILNQWAQYIAYGVACEISRDRQDMESLQNLTEGFLRQEALVLERQGVEEIGQRNTTIFSQVVQNQNFGSPNGWY